MGSNPLLPSHKSSASSLQVKEITNNEDIITDILLRLSKKDLLRFKCVSKQWLSIISNPLFSYNYYRNNPGANVLVGLLLYQLRDAHRPRLNFVSLNGQMVKNPFQSLKFVDANSDIKRIWSCNGLFCVSVISYGAYSQHGMIYDRHSLHYYICNPTTKQSAKLPDLERPFMSNLLSINLAFDPQKSPYYKMVCVWIYEARHHFAIYSSETRVWEDSSVSLETREDYHFMFKEGVFLNNAVHWVSRFGPFLCFDVEQKCLKPMAATPIRKGQKRRWIEYFGESCGRLHLVEVHGAQNNLFDILQLEENYSEWLLRYRVDLNKLYLPEHFWFGHRNGSRILSVLLSEKDDNIIRCVLSTPNKIFIYYVSEREVPLVVPCFLHHNEKDLQEYSWCNAHQFFMSLSSV